MKLILGMKVEIIDFKLYDFVRYSSKFQYFYNMKSFVFDYKRYPYNVEVFAISFLLITFLAVISFFYAWQMDEGINNPDGISKLESVLSESFNIWRFPSHYLIEYFGEHIPFLEILFFPVILLNIYLYARLIERCWSISWVQLKLNFKNQG